MNIECNEKEMNEMEEAKKLLAGLEDLEKGKIFDGKEVMTDIKEKYGL